MTDRTTHIFSFYDYYVSLEKRREVEDKTRKKVSSVLKLQKVSTRRKFLTTNFLKEAV